MSPLVSSLVALVMGPLLLSSAGPKSRVLSFVDGFVVVTLGGIALLHILPHAVLESGAWVILGAVAGLAIPLLAERRMPSAAHGNDLVPVAALAIAVHAFIDGAMLNEPGHLDAQSQSHSPSLLAAAVVLHRLPEGLAVFWLVKPRRGAPIAWAALAVVAIATVLGATVGGALLAHAPPFLISLIEAFVAGALLHVLTHHAPPSEEHVDGHHGHSHGAELDTASRAITTHTECSHDHADDPEPAHEHAHGDHDHDHDDHPPHDAAPSAVAPRAGIVPALGALAGVATLVGLSQSHPVAKRIADEIGMGTAFLTLALASAPALLASYLAVSVIHAFLPSRSVAWVKRGGVLGQVVRGTLLGPLLPTCSCGVLPLYRSLIARGVPKPAALSLLVAAPEVGFTSILLSISLLGAPLTLARAASAIATALVVGYVAGKVPSPPSDAHARLASLRPEEPIAPLGERLRKGLRYGLAESVDHTAPWIIVGLLIAAFVEPTFGGSLLTRAPAQLDVPALALLGIPVYVCAAGATPIVAVLMHKGLSAGAAIAFLLTGPATNVSTFGMLARLHGRAVAAVFALAMIVTSTALGIAVNLAFAKPALPELHAAAQRTPSSIEVASLVILGALLLASLFRQGPRGLVAQLSPGHSHT